MPATRRDRGDPEQKLTSRAHVPRGRRRVRRKVPQEPGHDGLDQMELLSLVCNYFCQGHMASDIKELLEEQHAIQISREKPYQLIAYAASQRWMQFTPPQEYSLAERIKENYAWLHDVRVVQTAVADDVARSGAKTLMQLLRRHYAHKEVHVGFSGGYAMRQVARHFAELLRGPARGLPKKIIFHAMVAGFDVYNPTTDPNAFFTYFVKDSGMQVDTGFVGLHTPPVVEPDQFPELRKLDGIRQSFEHAGELNIIVTSARDWRDDHSALKRYIKSSGQSLHEFEQAGAVGDILWRPIGRDGPVEIKARLRAMTIMELRDVSRFVEEGKRVLLVAGPCAECLTPKTEIVKTVLDQRRRLITHLVIDSRCGRELLGSIQPE